MFVIHTSKRHNRNPLLRKPIPGLATSGVAGSRARNDFILKLSSPLSSVSFSSGFSPTRAKIALATQSLRFVFIETQAPWEHLFYKPIKIVWSGSHCPAHLILYAHPWIHPCDGEMLRLTRFKPHAPCWIQRFVEIKQDYFPEEKVGDKIQVNKITITRYSLHLGPDLRAINARTGTRSQVS